MKIIQNVLMILAFLSLCGMWIAVAITMTRNGADLDRREAEMNKLLKERNNG